MTNKDFKNKDDHTIEDFLSLGKKVATKYDFSNDRIYNSTKKEYIGASDDYRKLCNIEKFIAYMMVSRKNKFDLKSYKGKSKEYFETAVGKIKKIAKTYGNVIDPDSNSQLLQDIYKVLWIEDKIMGECIKKNKITGETLNSVNTTLPYYCEYIETDKEKKYRSSIRTKIGDQHPTINYILAKYVHEGPMVINYLKKYVIFKKYINSYHTLGNFMPVPVDCNAPRGKGTIKDYWDLTLLLIYNYYKDGNEKSIEYIVGIEKKEIYKKWLDSFIEDKKSENVWYNFIEKNYLQPFVGTKKKGYYPKELWKGHFEQFEKNKGVLPEDGQCIEFFKNATKWISARGKIMFKELENKINKKSSNGEND